MPADANIHITSDYTPMQVAQLKQVKEELHGRILRDVDPLTMNSVVSVGCGLRSSQADVSDEGSPYVITVQDDSDSPGGRGETASVTVEVTDVKSDSSEPHRSSPSDEDYIILGYDEELIKSYPEDELNCSVEGNAAVSGNAEDSATNGVNLRNPQSMEIPESKSMSEKVPGNLESSVTQGSNAGCSIKSRPKDGRAIGDEVTKRRSSSGNPESIEIRESMSMSEKAPGHLKPSGSKGSNAGSSIKSRSKDGRAIGNEATKCTRSSGNLQFEIPESMSASEKAPGHLKPGGSKGSNAGCSIKSRSKDGRAIGNEATKCTSSSGNLQFEIPESMSASEKAPGHLKPSGSKGSNAGCSIKSRTKDGIGPPSEPSSGPANSNGGIKIVESFSLRLTDDVTNDRANLKSSSKSSDQRYGAGVLGSSNSAISLEDPSSDERHARLNQRRVKSRQKLKNTTKNVAKLCASDVENPEVKDRADVDKSEDITPPGKREKELDNFEEKADVRVVRDTGRRVKKRPTRSMANIGANRFQGSPKRGFVETALAGMSAENDQMGNGTAKSRRRQLKGVAAEVTLNMGRAVSSRGVINDDSAVIDEPYFESFVSSEKIGLLGVLGLESSDSVRKVRSKYKGGQKSLKEDDLSGRQNCMSLLADNAYRKSSRIRKPPKYDDNFKWDPQVSSFDSKLTSKADPRVESSKDFKLRRSKKSVDALSVKGTNLKVGVEKKSVDKLSAEGTNLKVEAEKKSFDKLSAEGTNIKVAVEKKSADKLSATGPNLKVGGEKKSAVFDEKHRKQPETDVTVSVREVSVVLKDIKSSLITKSALVRDENDEHVSQEVKSGPELRLKAVSSNEGSDYIPSDDEAMHHTSSKIPEDAALRRKNFSCPRCKYGTWSESQFKIHVRAHKRQEYKCKECSYMATGPRYLEIHMRKHTGEKPFKCTSCEYSSSTMGSLNIHVRKHIGDKRFVCPECGHRAMTASHLQVHMRKHTGVKPYACSRCDYSTANGGHLKRHMLIHTGEKRNACTLCSYKAARPEALEYHMRTHSDVRNYKCGLCDYASNFKSALTHHMHKHYGTLPKHNCTECSYSTTTACELRMHIRTHTGEKPYKCSECQYTARRPNHMTVHMRIHEGVKPFKCSICDYSARTSSRLKHHNIAKHLGLKSHKCGMCSFAATRPSSLRIHERRRHSGKSKRTKKSMKVEPKRSKKDRDDSDDDDDCKSEDSNFESASNRLTKEEDTSEKKGGHSKSEARTTMDDQENGSTRKTRSATESLPRKKRKTDEFYYFD